MAYEVVMPYHLHMPSYFLETFTEYPYKKAWVRTDTHAFYITTMRYKKNSTISSLSYLSVPQLH